MMSTVNLDAILAGFRRALQEAATPQALDEVKRIHLGKKSAVKQASKGLGRLPADERPVVAQALNALRAQLESELDEQRVRLESEALAAKLDAEWADMSLPGLATPRGARHPVSLVEQRCLAVMRQLGFELVDGPEVEGAFYNFDALNIPEHHPARDMQDTFWVDGGLLLRSHTTTVQARVLEQRPAPPLKVASAGRVYRNEAVDATHLAMFHQLEGFWLDEGLGFAHLKGLLAFVAKALFGDRPLRFKPKFYPYTEPSVGLDVLCSSCDGRGCGACHGAGWVTIIGSGMIHRNVLTRFGYDPDKVGGIAFGWGTTRMATQWIGVKKLKGLYEGDLALLQAVHRGWR